MHHQELTDLYSVLLNSASSKPEAVALIEQSRKWTYHELLMAVDRAADMFWQHGVRKSDRIALALRNSPEFVIASFALYKIGAVTVPINFMISKRDELRFILSDCHAKGILTQNEFIAPYNALKNELQHIQFVMSTDGHAKGHNDFWQFVKKAHFHPETHNLHAGPNEMASFLYTSGTTGHPKGVILTHANMLANVHSCIKAFHVKKNDIFLCILPMFHTFAWTTMVIMPLSLGITTVIVSHITPPKPWLDLMGREGVTVVAAVPQIFSVLAKEAKGLKKLYFQYWAFRKTRLCVSGAAPLAPSIVHRFEKAFNLPLLEGYGLTETSPVVAVNSLHAKKTGSVGRPLPGVNVKIMDDDGREVGSGMEGEICVKGPNVTRGYHANEQATREIFTHDGWLKTGDIGILDSDGFLFIRDRKKDMISIKGLKVFSAQVEHVIAEHPAVAETAVIGIPDDCGEETIKCFCVLKPGAKAEKSDIMRFIKEKLDPYKRPRELELVDSLPKNSLNKILKRTLRQQELDKIKNRSAARV